MSGLTAKQKAKQLAEENERQNIEYLKTFIDPSIMNDFLRGTKRNCKFSDTIFKNTNFVYSYLEAMAKYGTNHWWLSDEPATVAHFQMHEEKFLIPFDKYQSSIEETIGRKIEMHELLLSELTEMVDKVYSGKKITATDKTNFEKASKSKRASLIEHGIMLR